MIYDLYLQVKRTTRRRNITRRKSTGKASGWSGGICLFRFIKLQPNLCHPDYHRLSAPTLTAFRLIVLSQLMAKIQHFLLDSPRVRTILGLTGNRRGIEIALREIAMQPCTQDQQEKCGK